MLLVGLSYLLNGLIDSLGLAGTFQILSAVIFAVCLISALAFLPTDFQSENETTTNVERKNVTVYAKLLKNKRLCIFLLANFTYSFSYSVAYVHQVCTFILMRRESCFLMP